MNIAIQTYIPIEELIPPVSPTDVHDFLNEMKSLGELAPQQTMEDKFGKLFKDILNFCSHTGLIEKQGEMLHLAAGAHHLANNTDYLQLLLTFAPYRLLLVALAQDSREEISRDEVMHMWQSLGYDSQHKHTEKALLALFKYLDHLQMGKFHKNRGETPRLQIFRPALALMRQLLDGHNGQPPVSVVVQSESLTLSEPEPAKEIPHHAQPSLFTDWDTETIAAPEVIPEPIQVPEPEPTISQAPSPVVIPTAILETLNPEKEISPMSKPESPVVAASPSTQALNLNLAADMSQWEYPQVEAFLDGIAHLPGSSLKLDIRADMTHWSLAQIQTFFKTARQLS